MRSAEASISEELKSILKLWWHLRFPAVVSIQNLSRINIFGKTITLPSLTEIFIVVSILLFGFLLSVLVAHFLVF